MGIVAGWACFHYYKAGDYILSLALPQKSKIWNDFLIYYTAPIIAGTFAAGILFFKARKAAVLLFLWLMTLAVGAALDWRQKEATYTTVESWLNYGEKGMRETVNYLKSKKLQGRMISARSDIDYYLRRREGIELSSNIETSTLFSLKDPKDRIRLIQRGAFDYIVIDNVSRVYVRMNTPIGDLIQKNYRVEKQIGDFQILSPRRSTGVR